MDDLVTVVSTGSKAAVVAACSLLESARVHYLVQNDREQDLFLWGRLGAGFNPLVGPVRVRVGREDADVARELLQNLEDTGNRRAPKALRLWAVVSLVLPIVVIVAMIIRRS